MGGRVFVKEACVRGVEGADGVGDHRAAPVETLIPTIRIRNCWVRAKDYTYCWRVIVVIWRGVGYRPAGWKCSE